MLDWTDDFLEFRKKVESLCGPLEELAIEYPDVYTHHVLSHGFMEYAGVRGLYDYVKTKIQTEQGSYEFDNSTHDKLYWQHLKEEYLTWARQNNLPEHLLEDGWEQYLND